MRLAALARYVSPRLVALVLVVDAFDRLALTSVRSPVATVFTHALALASAVLVSALAHARKHPVLQMGASCWAIWWLGDAALSLWLASGGQPPPMWLCMLPAGCGFGAAVLVAGYAHGGLHQLGAAVVILVGFVITWMFGEVIIFDTLLTGDADEPTLRYVSTVGYLGWHAVLAVLLRRSGMNNLPVARATSRRASP